ncbi:5-dehydro-2-deoxygluconokinase [Proteiniclasticum ruminis]
MDLVLLGRAAIDFNPVDYYKTLSESTTYRKYLGGSPANIAVGLARLKKNVGFIGRVSDDQFGDFIFETFRSELVDTSQIKRCKNGEKLGLTFTEILNQNESSILMYRNAIADLQLSTEDIHEEYIKNAKALLISGTSLAASPSREAALKAVLLAKKTGTPIIFDIDYRPYNWTNEDEISVYYSMVASESFLIIGSREEFDLTERLIQPGMNDHESAEFWFNRNAKIVVIKHGKEGSTAYTALGEHYSIKPFPVQALKSFGGGDGYGSAFIYGLLENWPIENCLELGSASASMLVKSHGCSADMPTLEEIKSFIKSYEEDLK